jgi:hypothetical protein
MRFSLVNLIATATSTTASSQDAVYTAVNVRSPERPFMPWRSATNSFEQWVLIDFGSATTLDLIALILPNFFYGFFEGNNSNVWTAPPWSLSFPLSGGMDQNPWTQRQAHFQLTPGFSYRYLRVRIPNQVAGNFVNYFEIGGLWGGLLTTLPRDIRSEYTVSVHEPGIDVSPDGGAITQHTVTGTPWVSIRGRLTLKTALPPAKGDELDSWLNLMYRIPKQTPFLFAESGNDPAQVFVVRRMNDPEWSVATGEYASTDLELREST